MRKTRNLFKKLSDMKGIFHAKMGKIKDRNYKDLTEAEDIKKRWKEYTENLYKKGLNQYSGNLRDHLVTNIDHYLYQVSMSWKY